MADTERAALEHIRRVVETYFGEPLLPASPGAQAASNMILPVPYVTQLNEGADQFTNDSGAAAGVMMVRAYTDKMPTPNEFFNRTGQHTDYPLSLQQVTSSLTYYGVPVEQKSGLKIIDLATVLASGRPAILMVKHAVLKQAGLTPETFNGPHYLVAVGMDANSVYVHDPLRSDGSGNSQAIPFMTLHRAWTQIGRDYATLALERTALIPRIALVRRVRINTTTLNVRESPNTNATIVGQIKSGDLFEITRQQGEWGRIGDNRWISTIYVQDI